MLRLVLLLFALSGCVKHFECAIHGGPGVRKVVTNHFVISSELPEAQLKAEAGRLELLWDTLAAYFKTEIEEARIPVALLEDTDTVETFANGYSGFVKHLGPEVLVVKCGEPQGRAQHRRPRTLALGECLHAPAPTALGL